ncbi:unnamed protein product, partial [Prorocentrum cordatum]
VAQCFAAIASSAFVVKTAGPDFKRLVRSLSTVQRVAGALVAGAPRAAEQPARCDNPRGAMGAPRKKRLPQMAYLMALRERPHPDAFHIAAKKRAQ